MQDKASNTSIPPLSKRQKLFCREYVKDHNGNQSAIRAGYKDKTARSQASRLLTKENVQKEIKRLEKEAIERNKIEIDEVVSILSTLVRFDIADLYNEDGTIKSIHEIPKEARTAIESMETVITTKKKKKGRKTTISKVKLSDRKRALDMLLRYHGAYRKDNEQKKPEVTQVVQFRFPDNGR